MKYFISPFLTIFLLLTISISAQKNIPPQLQGYWQFKHDSKSDWVGMHVGKNYVEINYDLMKVDSISQSDNEFILYATDETKDLFTIRIKPQANDSALFYLSDKIKLRCKHYDRDPEIEYLSVADYQNVITGEWFASTNTQATLALKKDKLLFEGEAWNINWLGIYNQQEYRTLIENEGNYRLIYLVKQANNSWLITYNHNSTIYNLMSADKDKNIILGNWYEPIKNEWTYSFFEKFAIFDERYWEYKDLTIKKNKGRATLQNGNETLQLKFKKTNDSTLLIRSGKENTMTYKKAGRTLPNYQSVDTTHFVDNQFARIDTAYITGYLRNRKKDGPFEISLNDIISDEQASYYCDVDSLGRFQIKVPLYNSSMVFLAWRELQQMGVLEPNEHYFLFYDGGSKQTLFMGKNARIHNELAGFDFFKIPYNTVKKDGTALDFLALKQEQYKQANEYVQTIINQMPNPSDKFCDFILNHIKYDMAFALMQYRFNLNRQNKEQFPDEYLTYVRDSLLSNPPVPFTLNSHFSRFIRDYVGYAKDIKEYPLFSSLEVIRIMAHDNKLEINKADIALVDMIAGHYLNAINNPDTIEQKKLLHNIPEKDSKRFDEIYQQNSELINTEMLKMFSELKISRNFEAIDTVIPYDNIRKYYKANILYQALINDQKPINNDLFNTLIQQIETPSFRDKVVATQKFYTELSDESIEYTESLINTNHLKEAKDADALWQELISPYKGKIIYVDFWGTWCGPCKMEMEYVAEMKKQFIGKDVIFMYFANSSPEESWKNTIKKYALTGENVVQYRLPDEQQGMLERRFGIKSFPTYITIDRDGNVVDTKPPRPSQRGSTVSYLQSWLEK